MTYEDALKELQSIVTELQGEALGLEDMTAKVKRAAELIAFCRERLRGTEEELGGLFA